MSNIFKIILNDKATEFIEINYDFQEISIICSTCNLTVPLKKCFRTYDVKDHIRYSKFIRFSGVTVHDLCPDCFKQLQDNPNEFNFKYQHGLL